MKNLHQKGDCFLQSPDKIPLKTQQRGQLDYTLELGGDPLLRGFYTLYSPEYQKCDVSESTHGNKRSVTYTTPLGTLTEGYTFAESANSWFLTEHPVKTEEDFRILQFIFEHMKLKENYEPFHHACGHVRDLLPLMNQTPIDMVESISPPPTGNIDLDEAFPMLDSDKGLIGGIEPIFFENCSIKQLEERVEYLCSIAKGRRYILANSDSCPPGVTYEKFCAVSRMVRKV